MKDTICSVMILAATAFGLIQAGTIEDAVPKKMITQAQNTATASPENEPVSVQQTAVGRVAENNDDSQLHLQTASEIGSLKKADLLIGRRLQTHIEETQTQIMEEASARSQLVTDIQLLKYERETLLQQLAEIVRQLEAKADRAEVSRLDAGLNETRDEHERLINSLESQLTDVTNQLQKASKPEEQTAQKPQLNETPESPDTVLYSFKSTAGEAMLIERFNGVLEVELNGVRHSVMVKPAKERCGHVRTLRNLRTMTMGSIEFGYVDHFETDQGRRVHVKGYVVFTQL
jgi:hypothetical protein